VVFGYGSVFLAAFSASAEMLQILVNNYKSSLYAHNYLTKNEQIVFTLRFAIRVRFKMSLIGINFPSDLAEHFRGSDQDRVKQVSDQLFFDTLPYLL
jgi:hypothetical protein